ncbi:uncharacterized protein BP01DRAFT_261376, partial [Aspergillus saccharolyticus JOP 1030-1]
LRQLRVTLLLAATILLLFTSAHFYLYNHEKGIFRPTSHADSTLCPPLPPTNGLSPAAAIRCRVHAAQTRARRLIESQSRTPEAAIATYSQRYQRPPPAGFREWAQFALDHDSQILDEFDQIELDLRPFRSEEARRVLRRLHQRPDDWPYTRRVGFFSDAEGHSHVQTSGGLLYHGEWASLLAPIAHAVPRNLLVYVSTIDEPRAGHENENEHENVTFIQHSGAASIESLVKESCATLQHQTRGSVDEERDVCRAAAPGKLHGLVTSPATFSYTHALAPILSFGRMAAFRDILVPCPCYLDHAEAAAAVEEEADGEVIPFHNKTKAVYWRGRSTGGQAQRTTWRFGHRQRFVAFVHALQRAAEAVGMSRFYTSTNPQPSVADDAHRARQIANAFDVQMAGYIQCEDEVCGDMERVLGPAHFEGEHAARQFRILFDLDGNSMSTRFYHLLGQRALVLKQTWFQEWHDQRLIPWAHYVPVSMGLEELPALVDYFLHDPEGEQLAAEIAEAGADWSRRVVRGIDMSIYVYRLLVEMADVFG